MDSVSLSHHTVVEFAAEIHEPSMQFPQYNCRVLYPRVSILYETEDRSLSCTEFMFEVYSAQYLSIRIAS
jgi:hypothetical protein